MFTVNAVDPDEDDIYYKFYIRGPNGTAYANMTGWGPSNYWFWVTSEEDVGENSIRVEVRDEAHCRGRVDDDADSICTYTKEIDEPFIIT